MVQDLISLLQHGLRVKLSTGEREFHRKVAIECFNRAWDILDKKNRSEEDGFQMLHLAHASRYHWGLVGTPKNRAVGDWQLSRVYAELGQPRLALEFAESCLAACRENGLSDIEHTANEAIARAYAVAKDYDNARRYLTRGRRQLDRLTLSKGDRAVYLEQIRDTQALIKE